MKIKNLTMLVATSQVAASYNNNLAITIKIENCEGKRMAQATQKNLRSKMNQRVLFSFRDRSEALSWANLSSEIARTRKRGNLDFSIASFSQTKEYLQLPIAR